ncbi:tetratricopeptide repeat protein [Dysgonomonas sp. 511]|uniref:tetratricopeptide repeat protein n=1 Tax=Dysgonomonas sp. 511 TaxID=2302930 RepID=UPI002102097B|nr:tetratricopeptide repeat protein [Dysgonomonas sp. 511]
MKYLLSTLLGFFIAISTFAQNPGADYLSLGELKLAKEYFSKALATSPAESNYYLGEVAFREGDIAKAKSFYEKGLAADPASSLCSIGLAKLQLKSNPKEAEDKLKSIQKLKENKKNVIVILAIAQAYLDNGMKEKAMEKLEDARKADKKSPFIYLFEGDMLAKENKPGDAAMQYDQAINFDASCAVAYLKGARVYEYINRETAASMLKKALEINPEYRVAYKELAELYRRDGFYPQAIEPYKEYFKGNDYTVEDLTRYASVLYFTQQYDDAKKYITEGLGKEPNNFVLNRLSLFNNNEQKDFQSALAAGDKFFSLTQKPSTSVDKNEVDTTSRFIVQDYLAYGKALSETGNKAKAIEQYKKAVELDPSKTNLYKEIASICAGEEMYIDAAGFYKKYIELAGEKAEASDYFQMGRYYYIGAGALAKDANVAPEVAKQNADNAYKNADAAFAVVAERIPDSYMGYLWRARANASLDPETTAGLAKPYYELTAKVITDGGDADRNRELIESYSYLSYYYYLQYDKSKKADDKEQVRVYAEKILQIDPENANGKSLFEFASAR